MVIFRLYFRVNNKPNDNDPEIESKCYHDCCFFSCGNLNIEFQDGCWRLLLYKFLKYILFCLSCTQLIMTGLITIFLQFYQSSLLWPGLFTCREWHRSSLSDLRSVSELSNTDNGLTDEVKQRPEANSQLEKQRRYLSDQNLVSPDSSDVGRRKKGPKAKLRVS